MHIWSNRNLPLLHPENFLSISNLEIASVSLENQTLCLEQDKLVESEATIICLNGLSDWVFFKIPLLALAMVIEVSKYDKNLLWHLMPGHNVVKFFMELHSFFIHIFDNLDHRYTTSANGLGGWVLKMAIFADCIWGLNGTKMCRRNIHVKSYHTQ